MAKRARGLGTATTATPQRRPFAGKNSPQPDARGVTGESRSPESPRQHASGPPARSPSSPVVSAARNPLGRGGRTRARPRGGPLLQPPRARATARAWVSARHRPPDPSARLASPLARVGMRRSFGDGVQLRAARQASKLVAESQRPFACEPPRLGPTVTAWELRHDSTATNRVAALNRVWTRRITSTLSLTTARSVCRCRRSPLTSTESPGRLRAGY